MNSNDLISIAENLIKPHTNGENSFGTVGACLVTKTGKTHKGVCIDTSSGMGFCAEAAAIGSMVTSGEYKIVKIVAVWVSDDDKTYVLPPCGRCREFMIQIDDSNLKTKVILGKDSTALLSELLPNHEWPEPID